MARSPFGLLFSSFSLLFAVVLTACPRRDPKPEPAANAAASAAASIPSTSRVATRAGDAAHGKKLVVDYECTRCHDGTGLAAAPQNKHCVHCHKDIIEDRFTGSAASMARWKPRVQELADAPSLEATGKRFTRTWVEHYLLEPVDLRPHLLQYMPRLAMTAADAKDIAAYLVPEEDAPLAVVPLPVSPLPVSPRELDGADLGKGRRVLESKGCGSCHGFSGVAALPASAPPAMDPKDFARAYRLAPDLGFARERMTPARLVAWLRDPKAVKPDSAMPKIALTDAEVKDVAGYLWTAELAPMPARPKVERLPVLTRKVTFTEVDEKVFHRTCWHCHSEPDYAIGDGGPGNSGGLGFKPRGLNLSAYSGVAAGYVDDAGERQSVFAKDAEGVPRIVRALLARHDEERGVSGPVRGMPLGYEALSLEQIQLVETWVAEGRPR